VMRACRWTDQWCWGGPLDDDRPPRFGFICGVFVLALLALSPAAARADTFSSTVSCPTDTVVGPVTVLAINLTGSVTVTPNVPVTVALLPTANLQRRDNPASPPGTFTGTLQCTLTLGGVTVPFTRSLTLVVGASGTGDMTVGAVTVTVNLGSLGVVTLSAPQFTTLGYDPTIPIIVVPLVANTTVLLTPPPIPTLSTWGMLLMVALMVGAGLLFLRRCATTRA
jgi:hypothetical protein